MSDLSIEVNTLLNMVSCRRGGSEAKALNCGGQSSGFDSTTDLTV